MIRKKGMLIFETFLILTALCLAVSSGARVKKCVWCEKKDAEDYMKCITRRLANIPNFKNSTSFLIEMKTTVLEAAESGNIILLCGTTRDCNIKYALHQTLSELIDNMENYNQTIKDVKYILQQCYRVINKIPDQVFLDELPEIIKLLITFRNAQQPVYETKPDEISKTGSTEPLQDNETTQQSLSTVGPLQDSTTPQQLPVGSANFYAATYQHYYPSYLGSSASATSEAIYYGPQNNNGYNPNKADTSAVPIANAPTQLSKDNGNNVAASKSFAIDKYPDNNQKKFEYPSDNL